MITITIRTSTRKFVHFYMVRQLVVTFWFDIMFCFDPNLWSSTIRQTKVVDSLEEIQESFIAINMNRTYQIIHDDKKIYREIECKLSHSLLHDDGQKYT